MKFVLVCPNCRYQQSADWNVYKSFVETECDKCKTKIGLSKDEAKAWGIVVEPDKIEPKYI